MKVRLMVGRAVEKMSRSLVLQKRARKKRILRGRILMMKTMQQKDLMCLKLAMNRTLISR